MENQGKKAVLVISFGTSYEETRKKTLDMIERDIREAFPGYAFRRAYTSPTILRILRQRDGICVDDVAGALEGLLRDGYREVVAQTTHVISGFEYDRMIETLEKYREKYDRLVWGKPLLVDQEDYVETVRILAREWEAYRRPGTDLVLMGHGTEHEANLSYARLPGDVFCRRL